MREEKRIARDGEYASSNDFCQIFDENMNSLYLLAFLLTADHEGAEQCFVSGLEDAFEGNPVFKEWARSWARRVIIKNAVKRIKPRPDNGSGRSRSASMDSDYETLRAEPRVEISAVLGLEPFERFVYVTTVLEHYSDHECSLLLGCARREISLARTRALDQIGRRVEIHDRQDCKLSAQDPVRSSSLIQLMAVPPLATSA